MKHANVKGVQLEYEVMGVGEPEARSLAHAAGAVAPVRTQRRRLPREGRPAFAAYAAGQHETALATFMTAASGLEWDACRALFGAKRPGAEQAATISQPILSVRGSDTEPLWIEVADRLRTCFTHVEDCTITGVGHLLHMQPAEPIATAMAAFFGRHPLQEVCHET